MKPNFTDVILFGGDPTTSNAEPLRPRYRYLVGPIIVLFLACLVAWLVF